MDVIDWLQQHTGDFEQTTAGRIRCLLDGTEFIPRLSILQAFVNGKKYKRMTDLRRRFDEVKQFEPFFVRSRNFEDKVYCTLTGELLGVGIDAVRMHAEGKKYKKAKDMFMQGKRDLILEPEIDDVLAESSMEDEMKIDETKKTTPCSKRKRR